MLKRRISKEKKNLGKERRRKFRNERMDRRR